MKKVEGYTEQDIFAVATEFAKEDNRVYIAEKLERLLAEAQGKVLDILAEPVIAPKKSSSPAVYSFPVNECTEEKHIPGCACK